MFCSCALLCRHHLHHVGQRRRPPPLLRGKECRYYRLPGGPHGTAPSAQLLPFPLRPDLHRNARTPRARAGVRVAAARARHAGAGRRARDARAAARRGRLAGRRVGGARARGRAEGARGEGRAEFDSRRAYGTHSRNPSTSAAIIPTLPSLHLGWRRLHAGWCRCPARPWYSGCYLGSSRQW
jgi:hypothetical protein